MENHCWINCDYMSKYLNTICKNCGHEIANAYIEERSDSWFHVDSYPNKLYECKCGCKNPEPEVIK